MSFTEIPDGAGGWVRVVPAPAPAARFWTAPKKAFAVVLAIVTMGVGYGALDSQRAGSGDGWVLLEPDKPTTIDLGGGLTVRTVCGAPGQRVYATNALPAERSGLGVSLTVPGGVAVVADKECR